MSAASPRCASVPAALLAAALAAGCSEREPAPEALPGGPDLPVYEPRLAEFRALAAAGPEEPGEEERARLAELVELSFADVGDASLARRAEARLERDEHRGYAYEDGLTHEDAGVRAQCAWRLGELGRVAAIPTLFWRLRYEVDDTVRLWMLDALAVLGNHAQLDVLVELLDDARTAEAAAALVTRLAAAAGEEVPESPTWDDVKAIVRRLHVHWRRTGRPAGGAPTEPSPELEARLAGMVADLVEYQLRPVDYARLALSNLGAIPLPLLRRALSAEELYLRFHVIQIVRDIGRPAAPLGDALLPLLADPACRVVAIEALGEVGFAPAEASLRAALTDDDVEVRAAAAGALGPLGATAAAEDLRRVMNDAAASPDVRVRAAFSLALLEGGGEGQRYLEERRRREDYHRPTVDELLARVGSATAGS